jgi:putative ABC transport system permease protein
VALLTEEKIAAGMAPREARRAALAEAGGLTQVTEEIRDQRPTAVFDRLRRDVVYGLRLFARAPVLNAAVVLSLALGIGATAATFAVVDAVLVQPLAFPNSDDLVVLLHNDRSPVSPANFIDWRRDNSVFSSMGAAEYWTPNLGGTPDPERLFALRVSSDILPMLDVEPARGRLPGAGADNEIVIADGLWRRIFGADPAVLGREILLNGEAFVIVGVMPPRFSFPEFWASRAELWVPLDLTARANQRNSRSLRVFARLERGTTLARARDAMTLLTSRLEATFPGTNRDVTVTPLKEKIVGNARRALVVLFAGVGFVLLVACANVAHLLLARASTREREVALRAALGASRGRLLGQLLTESTILAAAGGAGGLLLTTSAIALIKGLGAASLPRVQSIGFDAHVLGFTLALSIATAILFGLTPALQLSRPDLTTAMRDTERGASSARRTRRLRQILIVSEVALAITLLFGAGLLLRSFAALRAVDPGWEPDRLLSMVVSVAGTPDAVPERRGPFFAEVLERLRALPGVEAASAINHMPLIGDIWGISFGIQGRPDPGPGNVPSAAYREVLPGYFRVMGLPLVRGRDFTAGDRTGAPGVIIVNQFLAETFWPGEDPIGKRMKVQPATDNPWLTVVGVAKHAVRNNWQNTPEEEMYLPLLQQEEFPTYLSYAVRTTGDPGPVAPMARAAVRSLSATAAVADVTIMNDAVTRATAGARFVLVLLGAFAVVALLLAAIGIYGIMSHAVSVRRQEISIRLALGATERRIVSAIVGEGLAITIVGVAVGGFSAFVLGDALSGLLFEVTPLDPLSLGTATALLGAAALVACYLPARRASRIDPQRELR